MSTYSVNAATAPDSYGPDSEYTAGVAFYKFVIDTMNQPIYWQLQKAEDRSAGVWETAETFMSPGSRVITDEGMTGLRFRAAISAANLPAGATQAVVTVRGVT